jgi:hypothetical protein
MRSDPAEAVSMAKIACITKQSSIHHNDRFDANSFDRLLEKFCPTFSGHTPFDESRVIAKFEYTKGQKREVQPEDCLGLVLV